MILVAIAQTGNFYHKWTLNILEPSINFNLQVTISEIHTIWAAIASLSKSEHISWTYVVWNFEVKQTSTEL